jgi:hypothetical protein
MATRTRRTRTVLVGTVVLVAVAAAGGAIWSHTAGAEKAPEPAALATRGTLGAADVAQLAAESEQSSLRGSEIKRSGQSRGGHIRIGDGDEVIAALTGSLTPVGVASSDGSTVVYSSWRQISNPKPSDPKHGVVGQGIKVGEPVGIPSVRIYDQDTGEDKLIEMGAYSPALSLDGQLAFVRGDANTVRQNMDYVGKIVVGTADNKPFKAWTNNSAEYYTYAWAGATLLAYKAIPDSEAADLYAFTGPGQARLLAPDAFAIAISPDGSRVLVSVGRRMVEVVRVEDGAIEASMPLDGAPESLTTPHALMFAGSWYGDRVVANSDVGLVVLDVGDGIHIESVLATPEFPTGITEPTLLDDSHLIGWANIGVQPGPGAKDEPDYDNALVECDLAAASCNVGTASSGRTWTRWLTNPSR